MANAIISQVVIHGQARYSVTRAFDDLKDVVMLASWVHSGECGWYRGEFYKHPSSLCG